MNFDEQIQDILDRYNMGMISAIERYYEIIDLCNAEINILKTTKI